MAAYDVSNVATIQISVYRDFGHIDLLPWIATAFSLANAAMSPLLNQIMLLVDLKWFMFGCWTVSLIASAVTGATPTIECVIVGRTILGISAGGIYLGYVTLSSFPNVPMHESDTDVERLLTYTTLLANPAEHARMVSLLGMGFAVGLVCGPIIGGLLEQTRMLPGDG